MKLEGSCGAPRNQEKHDGSYLMLKWKTNSEAWLMFLNIANYLSASCGG
jgi:hypothetical protein